MLGSRTLLLGSLGVLAASACVRYVAADPWLATWATVPQAAMPGAVDTFEDQQLRLIVRATQGGRTVRIRLSNLYGTAPLAIGAARIARREAGAGVVAGSERTLKFDGRESASIAPGRALTSDELDFTVPEGVGLAITLFLPGKTRAETSHFLALQTSYVSRAHVAPDAPFVSAGTIDRWPFLTGVDAGAVRGCRHT